MAAKKILLLLSSDRYAYPLLRYLTEEGRACGWKIRIGCLFDPAIAGRIAEERFSAEPDLFTISEIRECDRVIKKSDLVISMVNDLHVLQIADSCISHRKTLISPARLTRQMALKRTLAKENGVLLLFDCGFSPGLDHITAKKAIDNIHTKGGKITSFRTYSGAFVPDHAGGNPCECKLSEPVGDLLASGRQTNRHLVNGQLQHIPYSRLFERAQPLEIPSLAETVVIPEGDSLYYRKIYELSHAHTVVRGKIFPKAFAHMWNLMIRSGLTDHAAKVDLYGDSSFRHLLNSLLPYSPSETMERRLEEYCQADPLGVQQFKWLGLFDNDWIETQKEITPATILEHLVEKKLRSASGDRDCVVIRHELGYEFRDEHFEFSATLLSNGEDMRTSALATTLGYACGAAAKAVLLGKISLKGIHIPVIREIYDPVLNELEELGLAFQVTDVKMQAEEVNPVG
ncbi:MAG TPA: saccharopine dehydrogenase C-terminal domain-containing protein [Chryseosolibacter sp.]